MEHVEKIIGADIRDESSSLYEPLDDAVKEIRLLQIDVPHNSNELLHCRLLKVPLSTDLSYIALSYVWGDSNVKSKVIVNGTNMQVTTNLVLALADVSRFSPPQSEMQPSNAKSHFFWADALCINQNDKSERSHQVTFMREIYQNAIFVLGWLGPASHEITQAFEIIRSISQNGRTRTQVCLDWMLDLGFIVTPDKPILHFGWESSISFLMPILDLTELQYFQRTWILQEIVLAKQLFLVSGDQSLDFVMFEDVWTMALNMTDPLNIPKQLATIRGDILEIGGDILHRQRAIMNLKRHLVENTWDIIYHTRIYTCTNPRDVIYGLLGIHQINLIPDYSKPVRDVYIELANIILAESDTLRLLYLAGRYPYQKNPYGLPSWLPHFHDLHRPVVDIDDKRYSNQGLVDTVTTGTRIDQNGRLQTGGYIIDSISLSETASKKYPAGLIDFSQKFLLNRPNQNYRYDMSRLHVLFVTLFELSVHTEYPQWNSEEDPDVLLRSAMAFLRTILMQDDEEEQLFQDRLSNIGYPADENFVKSLFTDIFYNRTYVLPNVSGHDAILYAKGYDSWKEVSNMVGNILSLNYMFHSSSGFLGVKTWELTGGDLICVLNHCKLPVILRRIEEHYMFVSCCSVFGLMNGEAKDIIEAEGIEQQEFIII